MADREQPYDPYIPSNSADPAAGDAGAQNGSGNQRTAALQAVSVGFTFIVRGTSDTA